MDQNQPVTASKIPPEHIRLQIRMTTAALTSLAKKQKKNPTLIKCSHSTTDYKLYRRQKTTTLQ